MATWDILNEGDLLGYIYQNLQTKEHKKNKGQFFTDNTIVSFIINRSLHDLQKDQIRILDPACGSGQFLISAVRNLCRDQYSDSARKQKIKSLIKESIFGLDIDPVAVSIARYNLSKISGCCCDEINIHRVDFLRRDDLNLCSCFNDHEPFDLITGNPPWGSKMSNEIKRYYHKNYFAARSGINTFTLFIERSFDFIASGGIISFLVPQAYLNIKAHKNSREYLLENSLIRNIALWGERFKGVFAPAVSIIVQEEKSAAKRKSNITEIHSAPDTRDIATVVPQSSYHFHPDAIFNINYSRKAANIISAIEEKNCFYLKGKAKFFLGIVTGNNALHISREQNELFPDKIIIGRDVHPYTLSFSSHYFNFNRESLQQVAPRGLYTTPNKILYRFIGKRLTFALDTDGHYTLNNVNGFIPGYDLLNIESTLSILNSAVIQYYYEKNFFTIKVLRGNLEQLPIKIISADNQKKLKKFTEELLHTGAGTNNTVRSNIEDIIFHEYGIKDKLAYYISEHLE
ncbi:MAG TPA: N-6 DNA methylase [Spirochaetota bacterium]|nr:N-6 DNA methylase [Spirochaetota bacterium]HPI88354.1 N-6 DNA methylase [Spirochaetota bacterium]HPR46788.1 N-6 DNA methylase [Spirochaetota bacterium]